MTGTIAGHICTIFMIHSQINNIKISIDLLYILVFIKELLE
ncbi:hypothetical protein RO31_0009 [Francisella tularensis subsp. tularensis str. SCHU S4 substr. NR-28534]|nr:hypothetical protein RO31_0009 [Francisella tularensis subsp. tularensis str. SCHU S4 substr. NR-28534]